MLINGALNAKIVGQRPVTIAKMAGFEVPEDTKVLIGEATSTDTSEAFGHEKLTTILGMYKSTDFDNALDIAEDFKAVYDGAKTREEAVGRLSGFVGKWSMTYPSLKAYLTMPNLFTYFDFPSPVRKSIYTSNAIESFNSRVKARLRKRVTMNSQENLEFCMTQVSRDYNRHSRQLRCIDGMSGEELALCGLKR